MPKEYRNKISAGGFNYRTKANGVHEYRLTYNGITTSASSKEKRTAKQKFINAIAQLATEQRTSVKSVKSKSVLDFSKAWLEAVKKPLLKDVSYKSELSLLKAVTPFLDRKEFKDITPLALQPLFNSLLAKGQSRTAQRAKILLNQIFKAAMLEGLIKQNPVDGITLPKHEYENGKALTAEEEKQLLLNIGNNQKLKVFILFLYTGIRRCEFKSVVIDDNFVTVENGKREKGKKPTYRKIPITPMLRPYLPVKLDVYKHETTFTHYFKQICPSHHLHDLRHTFISRCQECGVSRELVSVWAGHAADKTVTTTVYTHFSTEYHLREAEKVKY